MLSTEPQQLDLFQSNEYIEKQRKSTHIPTPHYDKLLATLNNSKLPKSDYARVEKAIEHYYQWIEALQNVRENTSLEVITYNMVELLNEYKTYIDLDLIFDSPNDFLYRQKGQLKLDNTIVDEFLLQLVYKTMYKELLLYGLTAGPINHYCSMSFQTGLKKKREGVDIKTKSQGFALSKTLYIQSSFNPHFSNAMVRVKKLIENLNLY